GLGAGMVSKRPPAMTLLGLPWGQMTSWEAAGGCFITLAAVISLMVVVCLFLMLRIGVKPSFLVIASVFLFASLGPYPVGATARYDATAFTADSLFAWTALAAVLLISYESRIYCASTRCAILRGLLWAAILSLGVMTKISFLYFVAAIVPSLFVIRLLRVGLRNALTVLVTFVFCSGPFAVYLIRWGRRSLDNGTASSFGRVAGFYS